MKYFTHYTLILVILFIGCKVDNSVNDLNLTNELEFVEIFSPGIKRDIHALELAYPYLYVAAGVNGLYRANLNQEVIKWEYLPALDTTKGIFEVNDIVVLNNEMVIATMNGIWKSIDDGNYWNRAEEGIDYIFGAYCIEHSPHNPDVLVTHVGRSYIYWTENSGQNWNLFDTGIRHDSFSDIYWNPQREGEVWITAWAGSFQQAPVLYCLEDYGKKLKVQIDTDELFGGDATFRIISDIIFDMRANSKIYLAMSGYPYINESGDGGYTWTSQPIDSIFVRKIIQDMNQNDKFYVIGYRGLYSSKDDLISFTYLGDSNEPNIEEAIFNYVVHDYLNNRLFIASCSKIFLVNLPSE